MEYKASDFLNVVHADQNYDLVGRHHIVLQWVSASKSRTTFIIVQQVQLVTLRNNKTRKTKLAYTAIPARSFSAPLN